MKDRSHDDAMAELFKDDPAFAAEYLNQLLQDGEPADLLVALRQLAQAHGGVRAIAKETELNANQLYRTLSPQGNPELRSLSAVLKALGLRLAANVGEVRAGQCLGAALAGRWTFVQFGLSAQVSANFEQAVGGQDTYFAGQ